MNLWQRLFGGQQSFSTWIARNTASKVVVTTDIALQCTAFLRAARVIAEGCAMLPLKLYEETDGGGRTIRKVARDHVSYRSLCYQPCWLTKQEFIETLTLHAVVAGNGYAVINRGGNRSGGKILELLPLMPSDVSFSVNKDWEPQYRLQWSGFDETYGPGEILHIRGPSWDGRIGMDVLEQAREAIGLYRTLEQSQASLMGTDARPAGVLSTSSSVSNEAATKIRERWRDAYGPGGSKGVAVLDNGYEFKSIQMTGVDSQHIENRKFQIEEIARATGVFPQMLMHSDKTATFASASEFFDAHVTWTLQPWIQRWEDALKRDAIGWDGKNVDIWARISMEGLLRGNPKDRSSLYQVLMDRGVLSPNEVRAYENLNPRDGGDEYLTPLNMRIGAVDPTADPKSGS
jgi:HK97 family phage portal protein